MRGHRKRPEMSDFGEIVSMARKRDKNLKKGANLAKSTKKKRSMKSIERELWALCRKITFFRYGTDCYTCTQKNLIGMNRQCGHYFPKGALGASLKYDLRILRTQCFNCNINYGGMGGMFRKRMAGEIGVKAEQKLFDECGASKGKPIKARDHYEQLIEEYKLYALPLQTTE